jgi:hypothetical protein
MSALVWGAVAFFLFVLVASVAGLAVLALRGWRQFKALRSGLLATIQDVGWLVTRLEGRLGSLETRSVELQAVLERLRRSLAEARVLAGAAGEVADLVGRVRGIVPTK